MRSLALCLVFASAPAWSQLPSPWDVGRGDNAQYQDPVVLLSGKGFPISPMEEGLKELKIVPSYLKTELNDYGKDTDGDGFGAAVSYFQAWSRRWGWSVQGTYAKMTGTGVAFFDGNTGAVQTRTADDAKVFMGQASLVYDAFARGDRFRFPVYIGYAYMNQDLDSTGTSTLPGGGGTLFRYDVVVDGVQHGPSVGGSLQWDTGLFRWSPFFSIFFNIAGTADAVNTGSNAATNAVLTTHVSTGADEFVFFGGLGVTYKPWGMSLAFTPALQSDGKVFSLSLSKLFRLGE